MTKTNVSDLAAPSMALPHISELLQMHTYARPHNSDMERAFCKKYLADLPGIYTDAANNYICQVGTDPTILWSSHTDTVHKVGARTKLTYGGAILSLSEKEKDAACLGADCTVGVWMMRQMILRGVPGLYVFHAGEECGGIGSTYIADKTPELLAQIDFAIALDRRGETSIVTHQFGGRCCSDLFARSLASQLGHGFEPDNGGTFTDTANYTGLVSECTNISVGYYGQHTRDEVLDVGFASTLLEVLCKMDQGALIAARDPSVRESYTDWWSGGYIKPKGRYVDTSIFNTGKSFMEEVTDLAFENPDLLKEIFDDYGITEEVVEEYVSRYNLRNAN